MPKSLKQLSQHLQGLIKGRLWIKILIGMALGIGVGILIGPTAGLLPERLSTTIGNWLALPGHLFLALIQMIVVPLVFASVVLGIAANEDFDKLKKLGPRLVIYFVLTTTIAITIGISITIIIKPGASIDSEIVSSAMTVKATEAPQEPAEIPTFGELPEKLITIIPKNPLSSMVGKEMLQVVLFAVIIGVALLTLASSQAKPLLDLLASLQEVCMTVVKWAMKIAPLAVFGLLAQLTAKIGIEIIIGMGVYVGTVLLGLLLLLGMYILIVTFLARRSPASFLKSAREVQLLAFSTSSSAAVMPVTMKTAEDKLGISPWMSQFIVPLGATINMDGTALYQGVATIFLAQVFGVDLSLGALLLVIVTTVGASIGSPATPGVGIVILATVLNSVGIPLDGIALIIGVDRILDMSRTAVNVTGDLTACCVMDRWFRKDAMAKQNLKEEQQSINTVKRA